MCAAEVPPNGFVAQVELGDVGLDRLGPMGPRGVLIAIDEEGGQLHRVRNLKPLRKDDDELVVELLGARHG